MSNITNNLNANQLNVDKTVLKVTIAGGGPVGLGLALLLDHLMGNNVSIKIFDRRWMQVGKQVVWKDLDQGNARRQQVVTLQSRQFLRFPQDVQDRLFQEGYYTEMWPEGPDSIQGYGPRNIRVARIEDQLLEIANEKSDTIQLIPARFDPVESHKELVQQHVLVISEGGSSRTREHFIEQFGTPDTSMYSLDGKHLQDVVLGLRVKSDLPDPMSVLLTVSQNRFLLNSLNGEGFLNMRLTDDEIKDAAGYDIEEREFRDCIQSSPCFMERTGNQGEFRCSTHGTLFFPALLNSFSPLWQRIGDGLQLFGVKEENLTAVTAFRLDMVQRPRFTTQLYPPTAITPGTMGCLIGDAANAIHFWPGRGLNSGLSSAISLARCLHSRWRGQAFREADFTRHEGIMSMLQYRHKSRAWQAMISVDHSGKTTSIKDKIQAGIDVGESNQFDKEVDIEIMMNRLRQIKGRLKGRLSGLPTDENLREHLQTLNGSMLRTLVESEPWNTPVMGGEEVDVDFLFNEPDIMPLADVQVAFQESEKIIPPSYNIKKETKPVNPAFEQLTAGLESINESPTELGAKGEMPTLALLVYERGDTNGNRLSRELKIAKDVKKVRIGRNKEWNTHVIEDTRVSRRHAVITINERQELVIEDEGSQGHTYVNGQVLETGSKKFLHHDDKVSFGSDIVYRVEMSSKDNCSVIT